MQVSRMPRLVWYALMLAVLVPGCGGGGSSAGPTSVEELSIEQIGLLFRSFKKGQRPPPQGLAEVLPLENGYPAAIASLKNKEVVVLWGAGLSDSPEAGSTVLAYQKDTPEKGGEVLMQDGKSRKMTADEFKAAPKAGH